MTEEVFELQISNSFWENYKDEEIPEWGATIAEFENLQYARIAFLKPEPIFNLPDRIVFNTSYDILSEMELIHNNAGWPIVSKKMLNTLLKIGEFPHQSIPLIMVDKEHQNNDFIALQLLEHLDAFDWDRSSYNRCFDDEDTLMELDKLVLKQTQNGFPPIFRVKTIPNRLFVSAEARTALENADIRGLEFISLGDFEFELLDTLKFDYRKKLTRKEFASINNSASEEHILSEYAETFDLEGAEGYFEEEFEIYKFAILTPGQRSLCALSEFITEVSNGGISQFFWHESEFIWRQVLIALKLIGDRGMAEAYTKELQKYLDNRSQLEEVRSQYWQTSDLEYYSEFAKTYKSLPPTYDTFRDYFYPNLRQLEERLINYITSHPDELAIFTDA